MENEEWRPVVGFEGWYEVSSAGRVRRSRAGKGTVTAGYVIKQTLSTCDRWQVSMSVCGRQKTKPVHVLVARAFIGPRPPGKQINHIDYNRKNNARENLEYVTCLENIRHSYRHGHGLTAVRGSASPNAKLTERDVLEILQSPLKRREAALKFGVSDVTIKFIRTGRSWRHVSRVPHRSEVHQPSDGASSSR